MAEYDLSKTIIPYLDRHLSFPLLQHLLETPLFPVEEVQVAQYELAKGTNMFDYAASLFAQIHPDKEVPAGELAFQLSFHCLIVWLEFEQKRENAVSTNERLQQEAQAVLDVIENPDVAQALRQDKNQNLQYLKDNYDVRPLFISSRTFTYHQHSADSRSNNCTLQFWTIPILVRQLSWCCRLPVSFPGTFHG